MMWVEVQQFGEEKRTRYVTSLERIAIRKDMEKGIEKDMKQGMEQGIEKGREQGIEKGRE